jgi:hypothetical protein
MLCRCSDSPLSTKTHYCIFSWHWSLNVDFQKHNITYNFSRYTDPLICLFACGNWPLLSIYKTYCFFRVHWPFNITFKANCWPPAIQKVVLSNFLSAAFSRISPLLIFIGWQFDHPCCPTWPNASSWYPDPLTILQVAIDHLQSNKSTASSRYTDPLTIFYRLQSTTCCRTRRTVLPLLVTLTL